MWKFRSKKQALLPQPSQQVIPPASPSSKTVPRGLYRCPVCNEYRGAILKEDYPENLRPEPVLAVLCICDGIPCNKCGTGRIHRPISNYWSEELGGAVHCPWFSCMVSCEACKAASRGRQA